MSNFKRMMYLKFARRLNGNGNPAPVPSIIGGDAEFVGNLKSSGTIHIDGKLAGDIECDELVIGTNGHVNGHVIAKKFHIYGIFEGTADADSLFIAQSAQLIGDINHVTIAIEPGAYIDGRCIRREGGAKKICSEEREKLSLVAPAEKKQKA